MSKATKKQLFVLLILLLVYALQVFIAIVFLSEQLGYSSESIVDAPQWQFGLMQAGITFAIYALMGLAGYWFARKLGIPPLYHEGAGWRSWFLRPLILGAVLGVIVVLIDRLFVAFGSPAIPHPDFPLSIVASVSAAIGEEIAFRGFMMGMWAFLLNLLLKRKQATQAALWCGNILAAVLFSLAHLPAVMFLMDVASPFKIPALILIEIFLINSLVGVVAGKQYMSNGLIAAVGVHFWTDIVWHVFWPLLAFGI